MPTPVKSQKYRLSWPLNAEQLENIDEMFEDLYRQLLTKAITFNYFDSFDIGDILYIDTASDVSGLTIGTVGKFLQSTGTIPNWSAFSLPTTAAQGDLLYASSATAVVALTKDTNATRYLSNTGTSNNPAWAQVALTTGVTGTLPATNGGTGFASYAVGDMLYASTTTALSKLVAVAAGRVLRAAGVNTAPAYSTFTIPDTFAQGDVIYGSAANVLTALTKNTTATRYLSNTGASNNPAWAQIDLTNGVTGDLPFANLAQGSALSVLGVTGNAIADVASIVAGTDGNVLRRSGTAVAFGSLDLTAAGTVGTSILGVANGGTGIATLTANRIPYGNGTGAFQSDADLTFDGSTLTLNGLFDISGAAGGQIKFPASQNASANANTLDDYEEGTWTPVVGGSGGTSGQTYSSQVGVYVKWGRLVYVNWRVAFTAKGTITTNAQVQNLPFTSSASTLNTPGPISWVSLTTAFVLVQQIINTSSTVGDIRGITAAATSMNVALVQADLSDTTVLAGNLVYYTD